MVAYSAPQRHGCLKVLRTTYVLQRGVVVVDPEAYTYDDEVLKKAEAMRKPGLVEIYPREDSFIFTVESTGGVKASQVSTGSNLIEILKKKLDAVRLVGDAVMILES